MTEQEWQTKVFTELKSIQSAVNDLALAVKGDPQFGHTGLIQRQQKQEEKYKELEQKVTRMLWIGAIVAAMAFGAALGPDALKWVKMFF